MQTPLQQAKSDPDLQAVIKATEKLWRRHHLSYDQTRYVAKEVRRALEHKRSQVRMRVIERLSRDEERRLIEMAYRLTGARRLLIKTLFQTGARISEFVAIEVGDFFPRGICSRPTVIRYFRLGVSSNSSTRPFAGPVPFVHGEDGQGNVFLPPRDKGGAAV